MRLLSHIQSTTTYLVILSLLNASSWVFAATKMNLITESNSAQQAQRQAPRLTTNKPPIQSQAPSPIAPANEDPNQSQPARQIVANHIHQSATIASSPRPMKSFLGTGAPSHNWIEKILVQFDSQFNQEQQVAIEDQDGTQEPDVGISLAPTDSAEDPLERWPVDQPSGGDQQPEAPMQIVVTENSVTSRSDTRSSPETELTEERLVDSNNLSAIIANDHRPDSPQGPALDTELGQTRATCEKAFAQCAWRKACNRALAAYNEHCQDLIGNKTVECSAKCLKAMIALRSSELGDQLADCDCEGNEYCLQTKRQSGACSRQVDEALNPGVVVSCSTATWICLADQLCSTALDYYHRFCQSLFSQRLCSQRCNNSLSILNRQPKASKLVSCQCDGSEEFPCLKYKTYTERLCLNKPPSPTSHQFLLEDQHPLSSSAHASSQHRARRRDSSRFLAFTSAAHMEAPSMAIHILITGTLLFMLQALNFR